MTMLRRNLRPLLGGLAIALAAALPRSAAAEESKLTDVVVANPAFTISFGANYLAEDLGIYKKNGLNVKTLLIHGVGATNAVISGSADFVEAASTSITRAIAKGQKLLVIAETIDRPSTIIVLRKELADAAGFDPEAPLKSRTAILRNRTIAVDSTGSLIDSYLLLILKRAGIDPSGVQIPTMQPVNMLAALQAKQIDGFAMAPPWPLIPVIQGTAVTVASGPKGDPADLDPFATSIVATRPETCQQRRSVCIAMGHSFAEAEAYIHHRPKEAAEVLKKRFPKLDDKVFAAAFDVLHEISPSPPIVSQKGLENAERFNIDAGLLKPEEKLKSFDGIFTNEFAK
jgi:NitT/TauT family transport system substrate-binding protein